MIGVVLVVRMRTTAIWRPFLVHSFATYSCVTHARGLLSSMDNMYSSHATGGPRPGGQLAGRSVVSQRWEASIQET